MCVSACCITIYPSYLVQVGLGINNLKVTHNVQRELKFWTLEVWISEVLLEGFVEGFVEGFLEGFLKVLEY